MQMHAILELSVAWLDICVSVDGSGMAVLSLLTLRFARRCARWKRNERYRELAAQVKVVDARITDVAADLEVIKASHRAKQHVLDQRQFIRNDRDLWAFYNGFRTTLEAKYIRYLGLKSGKVQRSKSGSEEAVGACGCSHWF